MAAKEAKFRGHLHFPIRIGEADFFTPDDLAQYHANNTSGNGGWYPIGANQTWHNGIHFTRSRGQSIHSIARGKIIAARLGTDYSDELYPYGSPRFVLLQHDLSLLKNPSERDPAKWETRDIKFYTLFMHLDCTLPEMGDVPWLKSFLPFLNSSTRLSGPHARINVAEDGSGAQKGLNCRAAPTEGSNGKWVKGAVICVLPKGTIVELCEGLRGKYREVNVPEKNLTSVWIHAEGNRLASIPTFTEQLNALRSGGCAKLDYPVEAGEVIGHAGVVSPARLSSFSFRNSYGVHVELFAATNIVAPSDSASWTLVEDDTDDDVICEYKALLEKVNPEGRLSKLLKLIGWDTSDFASADDVTSYFRALTDTDRDFLHHCITRNTSFWSIDWKAMAASNPAWAEEFDLGTPEQETANRYSWWKECENKGVELPARTEGRALVYHYHPLSAMAYIQAHLPTPPIFFVVRANKEYVVSGPGDINIEAREKVWVYEPGKPDWKLGRGYTLQGCEGLEDVGETDLYEALITPATAPGIPTLPQRDKNIWASIWRSEGALEAINSYDSAFLSFGPMQQTVGQANKQGELQGALHYIKNHAEPLFQKYFGQYELDVCEVNDAHDAEGSPVLVYGHVQVAGKVLKTAAEKQPLRDFIWAYRCVKAMEDADFRRHFLTHGFTRLDIVRGFTAKFGTATLQLADVYKMELSLALILDAHINLPSLAEKIWVKAVKSVMGLSSTSTLDPESITEANEYAMIREIIRLRNASSMWSPSMRAACIVLCTENLDDALAQRLGYDDVDDIKTQTESSASVSAGYVRDFLGHSR